MRFLKSYAAAASDTEVNDARQLFSEVWGLSRERKILSVAPEGDVHETWQ